MIMIIYLLQSINTKKTTIKMNVKHNMTTQITNETIKKIDIDDIDFSIIYDDFKTIFHNIDENYNEYENDFVYHFIKLYDAQQFHQFIIDYYYILKLYDEYKITKSNDFFDDLYIINNIDFYDDATNCILSQIDDDNDVSFDYITTIMQFDKNDVCDILFNNIVNV
jgi:hypothetical protein